MQINKENDVEGDGQVTEDNEGEMDEQAEEEVKKVMEVMEVEEDWVDEREFGLGALDSRMDELPWPIFTDQEPPDRYISLLAESKEVPVPSSEHQQPDLDVEAVTLPELEGVPAPEAVQVEGVPSPRAIPIDQYQTPRPLGKRTPVDAVKVKVSKDILHSQSPLDTSIPHVSQPSKLPGAPVGEGMKVQVSVQ